MEKYCKKCNLVKPLNEFYKKKSTKDGFDYKCKACHKEYFYEISSEVTKKYYNKNKDIIISKNREYELKNKDQTKKNHRKYMEKRRHDPKYKLIESTRALIYHHLKSKSNSSNEYIGCTYKEYSSHLENQFDEKMNWDNYGTYWEVDHTIPLSKGGSFHYTNTTPMVISENRKKSNKLLDNV